MTRTFRVPASVLAAILGCDCPICTAPPPLRAWWAWAAVVSAGYTVGRRARFEGEA